LEGDEVALGPEKLISELASLEGENRGSNELEELTMMVSKREVEKFGRPQRKHSHETLCSALKTASGMARQC
jgi:hypothetical protein